MTTSKSYEFIQVLEQSNDRLLYWIFRPLFSVVFIEIMGWLAIVMFGFSFSGMERNLAQGREIPAFIAACTCIMFLMMAVCMRMIAADIRNMWDEEKPFTVFNAAAQEYLAPLWGSSGVYIIQDMNVTGYCKIGRTNSFARRMHRFEVVLPFRWQIIHLIPHGNPYVLETVLHRRFADKRKRGEWFDLSEQDIAWLKEMTEG